jgi:hypothetical protein
MSDDRRRTCERFRHAYKTNEGHKVVEGETMNIGHIEGHK